MYLVSHTSWASDSKVLTYQLLGYAPLNVQFLHTSIYLDEIF